MKKPSKFTIQRAKRTMFGRTLCRLFGEQTGAVLMEYVVLGVLVVAAVVGLAVVFGEQIGDNFELMVYALQGDDAKVESKKEEMQNKRNQRVKDKKDRQKKITKQE